jgi:SAM-dependent methyltransferase
VNDELDVTSRFYDAAAARYDAAVDRSSNNMRLRDAFRGRVSSLAGRSGTILDFGCGTGTDAACYAAQGHPVVAYDISDGMIEALRTRCTTEISDGAITAVAGSLSKLVEALARVGPVTVIAANFAVLNHVRDIRSLLEALAPDLAENGAVVASLLNPFYRRDMVRSWWWRAAPDALRSGAIRFHGDVTTYRHFRRSVSTASPRFALTEWCGASRAAESHTGTIRPARAMLDENFIFTVLRKRG